MIQITAVTPVKTQEVPPCGNGHSKAMGLSFVSKPCLLQGLLGCWSAAAGVLSQQEVARVKVRLVERLVDVSSRGCPACW